MIAMTASARRRAGFVSFFVVTFAVTWTSWFIMVAPAHDVKWLHFVGSLGPAIGAVVACTVSDGADGLRQLWRSATRWRVPAWTWGVAVLLPFGLYALGLAVSAVLGTSIDVSQFFSTDELGSVGPALVLLEIVFFGLGEEIGWRGFLLPQLERSGRTPYLASTLFIPIWVLWHLPLFFYAYGLGDMSPMMIPGWLISIALSTYLLSWLFHSSGQSVLVVALFHGVVDLVSITSASSTPVLIVLNAGLIAAAVLTVTRSRLLFKKPKVEWNGLNFASVDHSEAH